MMSGSLLGSPLSASAASSSLLSYAAVPGLFVDEHEDETVVLRHASDIDALLPHATNYSFLIWLFMLLAVYACTEEWQYLGGEEQQAAILAATSLGITTLMLILPIAIQRRMSVSGIVYAALVVQLVAFLTNLLLACAPVPVLIDPHTQVPVYLLRWCEWTPLAGLMTFLTESVALRKQASGLKWPIWVSLSQSLSVLCGLLFPFCRSTWSWSVCITVSTLLYTVMIPRCYYKYHVWRRTVRGSSFASMEHYERVRFAFTLIFACTIIWSILVVLYFFNMIMYHLVSEEHWYRQKPVTMLADTFFDVLAKGLYMKLIVDVHESVFDRHKRAQRQLSELRCLMGVLWERSSDVICMSVPHHNKQTGTGTGTTTDLTAVTHNRSCRKMTSMLSPSFLDLVGATLPYELRQLKSVSLMLETQQTNPHDRPDILSAYYVDRYDDYMPSKTARANRQMYKDSNLLFFFCDFRPHSSATNFVC